ncbi:MAG: PD-(D/E)XK nuclease family protein [Elusimicrobia bacterium]|nr:PD-(D/E)XK nuclease family protein [Elusimicrobiota bacterium]
MSQKIILIKPEDSIVSSVADILMSAKNLENNIVVFPGKRPAHFLRKLLAEKKGAQVSPKIFSIDDFVDFVSNGPGIGSPVVSKLDLAALLYDNLKDEVCEVAGTKTLNLDAFLPWAFKMIGDFEEIKIELKTDKELSQYDEILPDEINAPQFLKKFKKFSKLYKDFYSAIETSKLLTRALKYSNTVRDIENFDSGKYENIIFAGFFALTASEKAILKFLCKEKEQNNVSLMLESGPGLIEQFSFLPEMKILKDHEIKIKPKTLENTSFYKASDIHGEIFKLSQVLKARKTRKEKKEKETDIIVLPSADSLFPLIQNVLTDVDEYNISMGYPVTSTPVYALIDSLADLLDTKSDGKYFAPNYLKFVFHPYIKNIYFQNKSAETSRIIFQSIEEVLSGSMNKYISLADIEQDADIIEKSVTKLKRYGDTKISPAGVKKHIAFIHNTVIKPFEELKDIEDFGLKLLDFISFLSASSTANLHAYWAPFVQVAIESIIEFKNSALNDKQFTGIAAYFKFFKTFMNSINYPFHGTPLKGLQVLGFLETRNLKFDNVYFLDANADIMPASKKEDTVLSHFIRENLGLSTYKSREKISKYYFNVLIGNAKEAHIFYKDSADKERSPFVEKLIWDIEKEKKKPKENDVYFEIQFEQTDPKPVTKDTAIINAMKKREFSPSSIDTYLKCGLQFYYKYVLGIMKKDEISDEIQQRDIGTIVHDILENYFKLKMAEPSLDITEDDYKLLKKEAKKIFDARIKNHDIGYEYIIKVQIEKRLNDILDYHKKNFKGIKILGCEQSFKTSISTKYGDMNLKGRADRIDDRKGSLNIIDYKTGAMARVPNWKKFDLANREEWHKTLKSVQLPFYILAYLKTNPHSSVQYMDASLMMLGKEKIEEQKLFKEMRGKAPNKVEIFDAYQKAIVILIEEILDIDKPFEMTCDEKTCVNCQFKTACGRQWVA